LAQLYLACWSPERARAQRFRQQLDEYTTLAVRASAGATVE
jgi:type II secretory pathway component PulM